MADNGGPVGKAPVGLPLCQTGWVQLPKPNVSSSRWVCPAPAVPNRVCPAPEMACPALHTIPTQNHAGINAKKTGTQIYWINRLPRLSSESRAGRPWRSLSPAFSRGTKPGGSSTRDAVSYTLSCPSPHTSVLHSTQVSYTPHKCPAPNTSVLHSTQKVCPTPHTSVLHSTKVSYTPHKWPTLHTRVLHSTKVSYTTHKCPKLHISVLYFTQVPCTPKRRVLHPT